MYSGIGKSTPIRVQSIVQSIFITHFRTVHMRRGWNESLMDDNLLPFCSILLMAALVEYDLTLNIMESLGLSVAEVIYGVNCKLRSIIRLSDQIVRSSSFFKSSSVYFYVPLVMHVFYFLASFGKICALKYTYYYYDIIQLKVT